jgi:hypothetical protein
MLTSLSPAFGKPANMQRIYFKHHIKNIKYTNFFDCILQLHAFFIHSNILYRAFIDFLIETTGVPLSAFHINGHSAGAHVSGAVGLGYRERHNFTKILPRVTG